MTDKLIHTLAQQPIIWVWRACVGGTWGAWRQLEVSPEKFRESAWKFNLENGTAELMPLYEHPAAPAEAAGEAVDEALRVARVYAETLQDDWPEEVSGPTATDLGEALITLAPYVRSGQKGDAEYQELARELLQASDEYDRGHGPLHALAANAILYLLSRPQSPAATEGK